MPLYRQIERILRDAIERGELAYGSRLQTVPELAKQYNTSLYTIQTALGSLEKDGLVQRSRSRGTFITGGVKRLTSVGIYFGQDMMSGGSEMSTYRLLAQRLRNLLEERGIIVRSWVDDRPPEAQATLMPEIVKAVSAQSIQGVIGTLLNPEKEKLKLLKQLGIPFTCTAMTQFPSQVSYNRRQMAYDGIAELKRLGCRTVGTILPFDLQGLYREPLDAYTDAVADLGMKTRDEWVCVPDEKMEDHEYESFGYNQFLSIWNRNKRPDGLLVYPDTIVRGVVTGILQCGIETPRDLKLVLHRNKRIPLFCPLRTSWLETDIDMTAKALIGQLEKLREGKDVSPILLSENLIPYDENRPS